MKNRSLPAQLIAGLLLAIATLSLSGCSTYVIYRIPAENFAGRPIPPSALLERVLTAYTTNGSQGGLEILDGLRDLRSNVQNTITSFNIKGFSGGYPNQIINYPEQTTGYVLNYLDGTLTGINYSTEAATGSVAGFGNQPPSVAAAPGGILYAAAVETAGVLGVAGSFGSVSLNLPNVYKVVTNSSATVILAMVRNSDQLYRVVKLPATNNPVYPPGYIDCQPILLPTYCVVPVGNTSSAGTVGKAYDRPSNAIFSLDGTQVYVLNCGPECGGTTSGVTVLQVAPLVITTVPTVDPLSAAAPTPLTTLPVANPVPVPGGATVAIPDGNFLYISGQQLQSSGLFAGNLSLLSLPGSSFTTNAPYTVTNTYSISDGTHTRMLFADNSTLWIGSQQCASGARFAAYAASDKTQAANYNCLTRFSLPNDPTQATHSILPSWVANQVYISGNTITDGTNVQVVVTGGTSAKTAPSFSATLNGTTTDSNITWVNVGPVTPVQIIPIVTPNNTTIQVPYPNTNLNPVYYGSLYGECWVQNFFKIYTAYGGQIHAFNTTDGSEIDNYNITIQGTVLDVAYMDAESNSAN